MEDTFLQLVITSFLLTGILGEKSRHSCLEYATEQPISEDEKSFSFHQDFTDKFPMTISFSDPVTNITSPSLQGKMLKSYEWLLEMPTIHAQDNSPPSQPVSFRAFHNANEVRILQIEAEGRILCESLEVAHDQCGLTGERDSILYSEEISPTERNFHIRIPTNLTLPGYIVDLFFTQPITNIDVKENPSVRVVKSSPTHWALAKDQVQERGCIKIDFFTILHENVNDVEAILLNGQPLYSLDGNKKKSLATFENKIFSNATEKDCDSFFIRRDKLLFTDTIIENPFFFEAYVHPGFQIGLVVDVIFAEKVKELRVWRLRSEEIKGNHWRVHNSGWPIPDDGFVRFDLLVHYFHHYYVKPVGVKINNEVICGLATQPAFLLHDAPNTDHPIMEKTYTRLLISVILVVISILISVIIFGLILIKNMRETFIEREHLYNFADVKEPQHPTQSDDTYLTVMGDSEESKPQHPTQPDNIYFTVTGNSEAKEDIYVENVKM